jgi:hypothetical protein
MTKAWELMVPLEAAAGRLRFVGGVSDVVVRADPGIRELCRIRFDATRPGVDVHGGIVTVRQQHRLFEPASHGGTVTLNGAIPWDIEVRGGVARVLADLSRLRLRSLAVDGGISGMTLTLPRPAGTVPIRLATDVYDMAVDRPVGVAVRVLIGGGASDLRLDGRQFTAAGSALRWETTQFARAAGHYDIQIPGNAHNLSSTPRHNRRNPAPGAARWSAQGSPTSAADRPATARSGRALPKARSWLPRSWTCPVRAGEGDLAPLRHPGRGTGWSAGGMGRVDDALGVWHDVAADCAGRDMPSLVNEADRFAKALAVGKRYADTALVAEPAFEAARRQAHPEPLRRDKVL